MLQVRIAEVNRRALIQELGVIFFSDPSGCRLGGVSRRSSLRRRLSMTKKGWSSAIS